ncbi:MAG: thioredoxin family protein [Candidatus Kapabacteria bacterium]|nr:thioredoxin family protein [Candidatus Kapabacteria bacterium]
MILRIVGLAILLATSLVAGELPDGVKVGDLAPTFSLKNVDGRMVSLPGSLGSQQGAILVFTCNHCPYSVKYEDRIIALHNEFAPKGYPVIAINPNDTTAVPEDSFDNMVKRAAEKGFPFPYVMDDTQAIAKAYGARRTPHVFVVSKQKKGFVIEYIGAIDDQPNDATKVEQSFVADAVQALLQQQTIATTTTKAIGCTIKWKK